MTERPDAEEWLATVRSMLLLDGEYVSLLEPGEEELLGRLADLIATRRLETAAHMQRIGDYSAVLARAAGIEREERERIRLAARLHDVGKIAIADEILFKQGELDPDERHEMQRHASAGHELLADARSDVLRLAAEIALTHHERYDGSGYPRGLAGDEIPIEGRIVAVSDVFDALICDRPYRRALTLEETVKIMLKERGTHFDPDLLDSFVDEMNSVLAAAARASDIDLTLTL
jgi:putative two-component system response regulator